MPIDFANHLLKLTLSLQTAWTGFDPHLYELFIKIFMQVCMMPHPYTNFQESILRDISLIACTLTLTSGRLIVTDRQLINFTCNRHFQVFNW